MKILKIVFAIVLVLVVIFFSIGQINPTFEYGNSVIINASTQSVWKVYRDRKKDWVEGFDSQRLTSGNAFEKDAEYETIIIAGEKMIMHEKILSVHPAESIMWALDNDVLVSNYAYEFKGDSVQTEVTSHYEVEGKNDFLKSILYLSKSYLKSTDENTLQRLKRASENTN